MRRQKYQTPLDAFNAGNYCYTAMHAGEDTPLKAMALILIGNNEDGLSILQDIHTPDALYYRAFGLWGLGQKREALGCIDECIESSGQNEVLLDKAKRLKTLMGREKIRVLTQARNNPGTAYYNLVREMKKSPQFEIVNIGFHAGDDIQIEPYENLESVLGKLPGNWKPDFYFCHQIEYNLLPIGIENASFPIIGYTGDYDLHIHSCYHHLKLFDALVVIGNVDHYEVSKGIGVNSFTFSKVFGIEVDVFKTPVNNKDIDIFFSGMAFHPYHDDKAILINRLAQLSEKYNVCILNHFMSEAEYAKYMARSKMTFTYVRRYGAIPSRGIEALRRGTAVLYQEDGEIGLFFREDEGAVPYKEDNLEEVAERILTQWDTKYKDAALRGMKKALQTFDFKVCMDRYLKFLALIALNIDITRRFNRKTERHIASMLRYPPLLKGGVETTHPLLTLVKAHRTNIKKLKTTLKNRDDPYGYNILAYSYAMIFFFKKEFFKRNKLLPPIGTIIRMLAKWKKIEFSDVFFVIYFTYLPYNSRKLLDRAINVLEEGKAKFPTNLSILFNLGRLYYHGEYYEKAGMAFRGILSIESFQYDPLDNFYPYDFFPEFFPYRCFIDEIMDSLIMKENSSVSKLVDIILSNAWYYLARINYADSGYEDALNCSEKALSHLNSISWYHLLYANALYHKFEKASVPDYLEKTIGHLKIAFDISPSLIHPNIALLVSAFEKLKTDENNMEMFLYVDRWVKYVKAQPDISLKESEVKLIHKRERIRERLYEYNMRQTN